MPRTKIKMVDVDLSFFPECPDGQTLEEAQGDVSESLEMGEGCDCPLCGRPVKAYHRKLTPVIVARLITLVGEYLRTKDWCEIPTEPAGKNPQFLNLLYWSFITEAESEDGKALVKPTKDGYEFVKGNTSVPSHVFFFNNRRIGVSETRVDIRSALEEKYDYDELMEDVPIPQRRLKVKG